MPAAWRAHAIATRLEAEGIPAAVVVRDLFSLEGAERHATLDAMVIRGQQPPMVLVGGAVASATELDMGAIVAAARAALG